MNNNSLDRIALEEVDSTNSYISANLSQLQLPVCVSASYQTSGRGQGENNWYSKKGKNLLFSYAFSPKDLKPDESFYLSRIFSLAVADFYSAHLRSVKIKWPNDIIYREKKLAGILIENRLFGERMDICISGMGLNINQEKFPVFSPRAASIKSLTGNTVKIEHALDDILTRLEYWIDCLNNRDFALIVKEYNRHLFRFMDDALYKAENELFEARISGVEEDGHLILLTSSGETRKYAFKEVEFVFS